MATGAAHAPGDWHRFAGRLGEHAVVLSLRPGVLPGVAVEHLKELAASPLPEELRAILVAVLLRELDDQVEAWCGLRPEWAAKSDTFDPPVHALRVVQAETPWQDAALLHIDDGALARLAQGCRAHPIHQANIEDLPVTLDLLLDHAPLASRELRGIQPGDIVVLGRAPVGDEPLDVILRTRGGARFRARSGGGSLALLAALDALMNLPEPGPAASFDDIQLPVEFTIGRLTLPLSRVRELAEGQVLDLGFDATTAVTLRINGQVVAIGELVRIAERTGVRITELRLEREP